MVAAKAGGPWSRVVEVGSKDTGPRAARKVGGQPRAGKEAMTWLQLFEVCLWRYVVNHGPLMVSGTGNSESIGPVTAPGVGQPQGQLCDGSKGVGTTVVAQGLGSMPSKSKEVVDAGDPWLIADLRLPLELDIRQGGHRSAL